MTSDPWLPPSLEREELNRLEFGFYQQYGETLAAWARIEQTLSRLFCELCELKAGDPLGPALFFSGRSFNTRAALIGAAIRNGKFVADPVQEVLRALMKKARQFEGARNRIAHGIPTHMVFQDIHWQGWRIKEGDAFEEPGGIGIDQLKAAKRNFLLLEMEAESSIALVKQWRKGLEMPPSERLASIQSLPSDALLPSTDPIETAPPAPSGEPQD